MSPTRYDLLSLIATGGMGEVWRGRDDRLERPVAVKVLKAEYANDPGFRSRFLNEARHAAGLHHPAIASVFDYGDGDEATGGRPYLVMELVDGQPLSALLRPGVPLDPERARDLARQAAEALAVAHATGVVHRDVKPANLLVTEDGQVKLTDFGIARAGAEASITRTGEVLGTPQYLSPEQASGETATGRSDVYALGAVLFTMLNGSPPFQAETPIGTALAHLREPLPDLPASVPQPLAAVVRRAMAKDPAERYADGGELAAALDRAGASPERIHPPATRVLTGLTELAGVAAVSEPGSTDGRAAGSDHPTRPRRQLRPLPAWWPLAAVAAAAVVLLVALLLVGHLGGPTPPAAGPKQPSHTGRTPAASHYVTVASATYVGRRAGRVERALHRLGMVPRPMPVANPGGHVQGTVAGVAPTGQLTKGTPVTVSVWGPAPNPPPPPPPQHGHGPGDQKGAGHPTHGKGKRQ